MGKVTSKLQITVPKALAMRHHIAPGDELEWIDAGESIRLVKQKKVARGHDAIRDRLAVFDAARARQARREATAPPDKQTERGWTRAELYDERTRDRAR